MCYYKDNRQIRIFLSSTFSDMQGERNELVNNVFPRLRMLAAKREVSFSAIDLRWGIKPEDAKSGRVVEICLKEIENSHPFFLGIVGNYYGTIAPIEEYKKNKNLQIRHGEWLQHAFEDGLSVTEIEMQFGAFMRMEISSDCNAPGQRAVFFIDKREEKPEKNAEKLMALKEKIRDYHARGLCDLYDYSSVEELGTKVNDYFEQVLNNLYPEQNVDVFHSVHLMQRAFCKQLATGYVPYGNYIVSLENFLSQSEKQVLLLTGESGQGKSALMAYWISLFKRDNSPHVIYYFVGNGDNEDRLESLLKQLIWEVCHAFKIERPRKEQINLAVELNDLMSFIAGREPVVIIIDGINQIKNEGQFSITSWLPSLPQNVKMVFTTLNSHEYIRLFDYIQHQPMSLLPMIETKDVEKVIKIHLGLYGKKLDDAQKQRIALSPLCKNSLALRTILDELIVFGVFEQLDSQIDFYISSTDLDELFMRVIKRHEKDYGQEIVSGILSLILAARKGLSEVELIEITGVTQLEWSRFYCSFYRHFQAYEGYYVFSHQYVWLAVNRLYKQKIDDNRKKIVDYFNQERHLTSIPTTPTQQSLRVVSELAYQYFHLRWADALYNFLLDFRVFTLLSQEDNISELCSYWKFLLDTDVERYSMDNFLSLSTSDVENVAACFRSLGYFCTYMIPQPELAVRFIDKALEKDISNCGGQSAAVAHDHYCLGRVFENPYYKDYESALCHYQIAYEILSTQSEEYKKQLINVHGRIATTLCNLNEYNHSKHQYNRIIDILGQSYNGNSDELSEIVYNWAIEKIYAQQSLPVENQDYREIQKMLNMALEIAQQKSPCNPMTAQIYYVLGDTFAFSSLYEKSFSCYKDSISQYTKLYGADCLQLSSVYERVARLSQMQGLYKDAIGWLDKAIFVSQHNNDGNEEYIANLLQRKGWYFIEMDAKTYEKEAKDCLLKAKKVYEKDHHSLMNLAYTYKLLGQLYITGGYIPLGLITYKRAYKIYIETKNDKAANEVAKLIDDIENS